LLSFLTDISFWGWFFFSKPKRLFIWLLNQGSFKASWVDISFNPTLANLSSFFQ